MSSSIKSWSLAEKLTHWDKEFSACSIPEVPDIDDVLDKCSLKVFRSKYFSEYLKLSIHEEILINQKLEAEAVLLEQRFQVLKFVQGRAYLRHFPDDREVPKVGFGSRFQPVKKGLGRAQILQQHLDKIKVSKLNVYLKTMEPVLRERARLVDQKQ